MKVRNSQLRDFLNTIKYDEELLKQMKEKFYLEKIQEAKDKKGVSQFRWNELPIEVEEKIIEWKKVIETGCIKVSFWSAGGNGYISQVIKKHHLTMKSFYRWIRTEYRNEDGDKVKDLPKFYSRKFGLVLSAMVNKECIFKVAWNDAESLSSAAQAFRVLTKNKTPSLEEFIKYRKKEKNITKEENQKKNDEKNNKYDNVKIGSMYFKSGKIFKILSETKTQYRVEVLNMNYSKLKYPSFDHLQLLDGIAHAHGHWSNIIDDFKYREIEWLKHKNMRKSDWILNTEHRAYREIEIKLVFDSSCRLTHPYSFERV
tara:strand:- start:35 stop:976 length:942 start_codon:yes stop_codon:yes gene_type:complete